MIFEWQIRILILGTFSKHGKNYKNNSFITVTLKWYQCRGDLSQKQQFFTTPYASLMINYNYLLL